MNMLKVIFGVQFGLSHIVDVKQVSCMSEKKKTSGKILNEFK